MTHREFDVFLLGTIIMCCVMAVVNLVKNGWRGWPGVILSASFIVFAITVYLWRTGAAIGFVYAGVTVLFLLLGADVFFRAGKPQGRKKR